MQNIFIEYVYLVLIIVALVMIANKLRIAYPIVLVLGGLALSFTSVFSHVTIDPDLVFFIFLPPLLFEAAWQVSWKEFWRWRRVIASFAFPIVILTSCVIAFVSYQLIPGFTLALGFLLGGIVSPPDAISATTIMRQVKVPKRLLSIIEGESLLNDASSLIVFRFALAAVVTGQFNFQQAAGNFFVVIVMGVITGLLVGLIFYAIYRWLPTSTSIEIVLTLVTPYCMYYFAEHFHFSGVLAVVSGGLFLSRKRQVMLTYQSRIQSVNVWAVLGFVLNGLVFILIGLPLPTITGQLGDVSLNTAIWYGLAISLVLILTRLFCALSASPISWLMSHFIKVEDPRLQWKMPLIFGWAGMRGVVSLAAALSIPLVLGEGQAFPYRNLIIFITFIVILVTLVLQGLTLPWLIRKLNLEDTDSPIPEHEQKILIQKKILESSLQFIEEKYHTDLEANEHLKSFYASLKADLNFYSQGTEDIYRENNPFKNHQAVNLELLEHQRRLVDEMNRKGEFDEELIRKYLSLIDLEEFKVREKLSGA
ncbi:Na+/H+ antiporter [Flavihumibacter sp. R14]|nr:Na+/H+ antiporter [Flavihumibacter soli]